MNRHYDRYLVTKYQPLYADRHGDMRSTLMCWGFEVGDGWFHIINNLSYGLCSDWLGRKRDYDFLASDPDTPAEKLERAKHRLDEAMESTPKAVQVKEKFGTLRFYTYQTTDQQNGMIRLAEIMSGRTCEICGKPGKLYTSGWYKTRCNEHK